MQFADFQLPPIADRIALSEAWAAARGLRTGDAYGLNSQHDWIHASFCLATDKEAIVCMVEEQIETGILLDFGDFRRECYRCKWADDSFGDGDIARAYVQIVGLVT